MCTTDHIGKEIIDELLLTGFKKEKHKELYTKEILKHGVYNYSVYFNSIAPCQCIFKIHHRNETVEYMINFETYLNFCMDIDSIFEYLIEKLMKEK